MDSTIHLITYTANPRIKIPGLSSFQVVYGGGLRGAKIEAEERLKSTIQQDFTWMDNEDSDSANSSTIIGTITIAPVEFICF